MEKGLMAKAVRLWRSRPTSLEEPLVQEIVRQGNLNPLLARILLSRTGNDLEKARRFLSPSLREMASPLQLPDMKKAVDRVVRALVKGETIGIHGDYDVDGVCSTALLTSTLRKLGAMVFPFVPERNQDGYGLSRRGLEFFKREGVCLVITCDCGITASDEVTYANDLGLEVIVTDHHMPGENLPKALAIVNPQLASDGFVFKGLCGSGVAFSFLVALRTVLREQGYFTSRSEPDLRECLDLVALATIADSVPLLEENRIFVSQGLKRLTKSARPGIRALQQEAGVYGKELDTFAVAFKLVPRLNVAGRMMQANKALALLLTQDDAEATKLARELESLNQERRTVEAKVRAEALLQIDQQGFSQARAMVLSGENWHEGVLGIVAARVCEQYYRPAAILSVHGEEAVGSVRGIAGINLVEALEVCRDHLIRFGGHQAAGGLTVAKDRIASFRSAFLSYMQTLPEDVFVPHVLMDGDLNLDAISQSFLDELQLLEPFGESNPLPLFVCKGVEIAESRIVGDGHLKLRCRQENALKEAIGFNLGEYLPQKGMKMDLLFTPRWNEYRGIREIQLQVKDLRPV